jgi:hypothetical protein
MQEERENLKMEGEKLAKDVIDEVNKSLGIKDKALGVVTKNNAKYFDWMDAGNGKFISLRDAQKNNLSATKIAYLNWANKVMSEYNEEIADASGDKHKMEGVFMDETVGEAFRNNGFLSGLNAWLGSNFTLDQVRIQWIDVNGKVSVNNWVDVKTELLKQGNNGLLSKAIVAKKLVQYHLQAKRQMKMGVNFDNAENKLVNKGSTEYALNDKGKLTSKFTMKRGKDKAYSKDFHASLYKFIDDMSHIRHMQDLIPYIESIEHFNSVTNLEHAAKPRLVEWLKEWKAMHITKEDKVGMLGPEADIVMKSLRKLTSLIVMAFNVKAGVVNIAMGLYMNWRSDGLRLWKRGQKRLILTKGKRELNAGGAFNKYGMDILRHYKAISIEYDENPRLTAGKLFDGMAHWLTRKGESWIQGSMILGQMEDSEFNSFEYNEKGVLVVKEGVDDEKLRDKMLSYIDHMSDIQGKYSQKDRRNFMLTESGRFFSQFRVWIPDWWKERFGKEYVGYDNVVHVGSVRASFNKVTDMSFAELRQQIRTKEFWKDKAIMQNLRGSMILALLLIAKNADDDDEKKRKQADVLDQYLGNLLFVFDTDQLKFMLKTPAAGVSTVIKFVDAFEHAMHLETYKTDNRFGDKGDLKLQGDIANLLPYKNLYVNDYVLPKE